MLQTPEEIKICLAALIEFNHPKHNLLKYIKKLEKVGRLNAEIVFVAIRLSCKKQLPSLAKLLLVEVVQSKLAIDLLTVSTVVQLLLQSGEVADAIEILNLAQQKAFGDNLRCDMATFSMIIESASRMQNKDLMRRAFELVYSDRAEDEPAAAPDAGQVETEPGLPSALSAGNDSQREVLSHKSTSPSTLQIPRNWPGTSSLYKGGGSGSSSSWRKRRGDFTEQDNKILMQTMGMAANCGDLATSLAIYDMYNKSIGLSAISPKMNIFLLSSFLSRPINETEASPYIAKMDEVIREIVLRGIDRTHASCAGQVFRYLVMLRRDRVLASTYLDRMIRTYSQRPSTLSILEYARMICRDDNFDVVGCTVLHGYMLDMGARPFESVRRMSLHRSLFST